ncbi:MAG: hypothetical protein JXJ04_17230 [Spirochaetales bacterium]|nr:hypothetical protein [Spirochaetales bacterium]
MLTSNEKKLLYVLAIILIACAVALFFYLRITMPETGLNALNKNILDIENNVKNLSLTEDKDENLFTTIEKIEQEIEKERSKFYKPEEIDIATLGLKVKDLLSKNQLRITNQRTITQKDVNFIEFYCVGKANHLFNFLAGVSKAEKYWRIDSFSIQSKKIDGNIDARMRITYETITTDNN